MESEMLFMSLITGTAVIATRRLKKVSGKRSILYWKRNEYSGNITH
jgi:hypothetical protein